MAEDAVKNGASKQNTKEKSKIDLLSIAVFLLLCINLVVLGGMGYLLSDLTKKFKNLQTQTRELASKAEEEQFLAEKELKEPELGILFPIESFLVNISSNQGSKFLQTQLEFELTDAQVENEISQKKPAIRDAIIVMLSSRTYEELSDPKGMQKLRTDLLNSVNNVLNTGKIRAVYFTQFHFN